MYAIVDSIFLENKNDSSAKKKEKFGTHTNRNDTHLKNGKISELNTILLANENFHRYCKIRIFILFSRFFL